MFNDQVAAICDKLLVTFESGELPPAVARTVIARCSEDNKPCNQWSFGNQLLMIISGTEDARGFRQWQNVKRNVKKGAKAIYILAPITTKVTRINTTQNRCDIQEEYPSKGFKAVRFLSGRY